MKTNIGVITYWPGDSFIGTHFGIKRWLSFYIFSMQAFGADTLFVINAPEFNVGYDINIKTYTSIVQLIEDYDNYKIVILTGKAPNTLQEYVHPKENVLYLFGNDYAEVPEIEGDKLRIDNLKSINALWSHNCVSIVLYDRHFKENRYGSN